MNVIDFTYFTLSYASSVVTIKVKEDAVVDVEEAISMITTANELAGHAPYGILTDARVYFSITPEARKIYANKKYSGLVKANAVIVNNLAAKLLANFFSNFNKPHYSFQVFSSEDKAKQWLQEKVKEQKSAVV